MTEYRIKNTSDKFEIDKCRESAESGYAPAQYQLGQCYEEGIGVERNLAKAFRCYWLASDKCRPARERLNKDTYQCQLAKWLKKAVNRKDLADADLAEAMCMLGSCYQHGYGVDCDMTLAVEWWRKAAEIGDAYACDCMGYCYSIGQGGLPKDLEQAFAYYLKAAERGYAGAYFTLGLCYSEGNGIGQDDEQAFSWFKKAAENDNPMAWVELGKCYSMVAECLPIIAKPSNGMARRLTQTVMCHRTRCAVLATAMPPERVWSRIGRKLWSCTVRQRKWMTLKGNTCLPGVMPRGMAWSRIWRKPCDCTRKRRTMSVRTKAIMGISMPCAVLATAMPAAMA